MTSVGTAPRRQRLGRRGFAKSVAAVGVAASLVLTSCGGGESTDSGSKDDGPGTAAPALEKFNSMTGQERTDALVKAAKEEGTVVFYTASSGMDPVIEAFEDKYDITVELYSGQSDTVLQRILQEYGAGFYGADVLDDSESFSISEQGMTTPYVNAEFTDKLPGYDPTTNVVPTRLSVYTQGWNTNLVNEDELPDTLDGFTDPRWKGKLSMDPRDWIWYTGVMDYYTQKKGWTEEQVDDMIKTLASYSVFNAGHTVQGQLLLAGEFPVSLSVYTQSIDRLKEDDPNAPVAWRKKDGSFIEPLIFQAQGATILKNAPHPAAAMLFVDFLASEGQEVLAKEDRTPTALQVPGGPLEGVPSEQLFVVDPEKFTTGRDEWTKRFEALLGQG
jgi:iron(III) transport system substrate-binding protein